MTNAEGGRRRGLGAATAAGGLVAGTAPLVSGGGGTAGADGPPEGDERADYSFTLEYFGGDCAAKSDGAWRITVEGGEVTDAEALNAPARRASWAEGAPTLVEPHDDALGVRADGAYDAVDIGSVDDGWVRRPARVRDVDRGDGGFESRESYESYETSTDHRPAG